MGLSFQDYYNSPIGWIKIEANDLGITKVSFIDEEKNINSNYFTEICKKQLDEYFNGIRKDFTVDLSLAKGTVFQKKVWDELLNIPYGETVSYLDIAKGIGNDKAVRAVGGANNKNPIAIIIPCHRVIGRNGKLIGYESGLDKKEFLINLEKNNR